MMILRSPFITILCVSCTVLPFAAAWAPLTLWTERRYQSQKAAVFVVCTWTIMSGVASAAPNIEKGQVIFENNCAACHAGGQNLVNPPRTLQKDAIIKNLKSLDPNTIQDFVQNSLVHRGAFILGSKLSNKDFENVVSYVVDQASNEKWVSDY